MILVISLDSECEFRSQIYESNNVTYSNISITAESTSDNAAKNTDGWDVYRSDTVVIKDSVIVNGDDCVSFKPSNGSLISYRDAEVDEVRRFHQCLGIQFGLRRIAVSA